MQYGARAHKGLGPKPQIGPLGALGPLGHLGPFAGLGGPEVSLNWSSQVQQEHCVSVETKCDTGGLTAA